MGRRGGALRDLAIVLSLVVIAIAVSARLRLRVERDLVVAVVRALVQLAVVAAIIELVFDNPPYSALFIVVMAGAASWTAGRRLQGVPHATVRAGIAISTGSAAALAILFGAGVFELEPRFLIPIAGMLIGNSMNATSVAGRLIRDELTSKTEEIEARLALGVRARDALSTYVRRSVTTALIPLIDSTKNVGLILLPGAFVGMILGGSSPVDAARVQAIVLFMLLGAVAIVGMITAALVARAFIGPGERVVLPAPTT